jgi:hypothetical protein
LKIRDSELRRKIESYDPDEDIEKSGGAYGMRLADIIMSRKKKNASTNTTLNKISLEEFDKEKYSRQVRESGLGCVNFYTNLEYKISLIESQGYTMHKVCGREPVKLKSLNLIDQIKLHRLLYKEDR